jgi:DNA invertase Pin-like site-specific DNA recombinase
MVIVSQWEREAIGERTRDALRHKRAKGERIGTVPYGSLGRRRRPSRC